MKKSLNNRIRGKRLVTGDENEVTKNEILIQDKDDKIIVKQRGASGEMENISGGDNMAFNLLYYAFGSIGSDSVTKTVYGTYKNLQDFLFSDYSPLDTSGFKYPPRIGKKTILTQDKNISIEADPGAVASWIINIEVSPGATGVAVPRNSYYPIYMDKAVYLNTPTNPSAEGKIINLSDQVFTEVDMIYDVASNILLFYSGSSSLHITINPELESSLRIVTSVTNHTSNPVVNGVVHYFEDLEGNKMERR